MSSTAADPRTDTFACLNDVAASGPVRVSTDIAEPEWTAYVDAHVDGTAYHLWEWKRIFEHAFGHQTIRLVARREGIVVGVLPVVDFRSWLFGRFLVSLPFVNYGGVLASDAVAARALLDEAAVLASTLKARHVEMRHCRRQFDHLPVRSHKVAMRLSLEADPDAMWRRLDRKVRNQVRKAEKSGLTAKMGGLEHLDDFYAVFARNMRDLGTPVYSKRFFAEVLGTFPDRTRLVLVYSGRRVVAGALSLSYRGSMEVPWASSLREYSAFCPNNLLYWTAISQAIRDGMTRFDFGRSTPDAGTYHFKRQWGAEPEPLYWEYALGERAGLPDQGPANAKFAVFIRLWKRLPVALTTIVGPSIVRVIP